MRGLESWPNVTVLLGQTPFYTYLWSSKNCIIEKRVGHVDSLGVLGTYNLGRAIRLYLNLCETSILGFRKFH